MQKKIIISIIAGLTALTMIIFVGNLELIFKDSSESFKDDFEAQSCNCVAFRLDDITDAPSDEIQFQIINLFLEKEIPLTVGIIGNEFGNDNNSSKIIKKILTEKENLLEIANHGWNHEDFTRYSINEQTELLQKTNQKLTEILGIKPHVFIPPYNRYNHDTIQALQKIGMTHMSSINSLDKGPYPLKDSNLYRFPATSATGEYSNVEERIWSVWPAEKTFLAIDHSISKNGFAVVMMHPQDFGQFVKRGNAVNYDQIRELELVIDKIKEKDFRIVPLSKINLGS